MNKQIVLAGFGGQGILFSGKFLAYAGLLQDYQISWLPSYGPEMRGGTANCNVIISDESVGSPIITDCTSLIAMNGPSYDKFIDTVVPGGEAIIDSSLISAKCERTDISVHYIPATAMAKEHGLDGLANMIMVGKYLKETGIMPMEMTEEVLKKVVSAKKAALFDKNLEAIKLGYNF